MSGRAPLLPYSVGSVLAQTVRDLEVFIMGDGVDDEAGKLEPLVAHAVGEADLREEVGQGRIRAARARQPGKLTTDRSPAEAGAFAT